MTKAYGPYMPIRKAGDIYFVSGQIGAAPDQSVSDNIADQTRQALYNLTSVLRSADLSLDNVMKTTIFLTNMDNYKIVNDVYGDFFNEPRPARSCVEVSALPKVASTRLLVEIEAIAYKEHMK